MPAINIYTPYVYRITHLPSGKKYIGVRYSKEIIGRTPEEDLGVYYFSTSSNKLFNKQSQIENKSDYTYEVLSSFESKEQAIEFETLLLESVSNDDEYVNLHANTPIYATEYFNQIMNERYGCDWSMQNEEIRQKSISTLLKNYGVTSPAKNKEILNKMSNTMKESTGFDWAMQDPDTKQKSVETCLKKYGVSNVSQHQITKDKVMSTNLQKYDGWYTATDEYKERVTKTSLERYGVENFQSAEVIKDKIKNSNLEKYGKTTFLATDDCRIKAKQALIEKYGVDSAMKIKHECPHCKKITNVGNLKRWHGDNCKVKPR